MVSIKGLAYALNNPSKEMLYMTTTDSIKFKTKSWIDVFGNRASKAVGSVVTNAFKKPVERLMLYGSLISLATATALLLVAAVLGSVFERLMSTGSVIGLEEVESSAAETTSLNPQRAFGDEAEGDSARRPWERKG